LHPHLVLAAHPRHRLPEGTDVRVKREGNILRGPGIGDDCRGLAVLVSVAREMKKANVRPKAALPSSPTSAKRGLATCAA
jgi:hypothetical protein